MPPSVNSAYVNVRGKGRVKNGVYRDFEKKMALWCAANRKSLKAYTISKQPLSLYFYFYLPNWFTKKKEIRKIDVSNFIKVLEDLLCKALGIDDSLFFEVHVFKCLSSRAHVNALISDELIDGPGLLKLK